MALPVGFTLITVSAINRDIPIALYWLGWVLGIIGVFAFFIAMWRAHYEDIERRKQNEQEEIHFRSVMKSIEAIRGELNGIRGDIKKRK